MPESTDPNSATQENEVSNSNGKMQPRDWVELLKLPFTIVITIASVVLASLVLGLRPTDLQIGDVKINLEKELRKELVASNINLEELIREEVQKQLGQGPTPVPLAGDTVQIKPSANDIVSDQVAALAKINKGSDQVQTIYKSVQGYIWLGNKKSDGEIQLSINAETFESIKIGAEYTVSGNMVIRENDPTKNPDYFEGEKKIGLAPRNTKVKILERPSFIDLGNKTQYWAKIEVME